MNSESSKIMLLVEDEVLIAMNEKIQLERYGYSVHHVNTGEKAVQTIVDNTLPVDLILMDINLGSGIDGTQAAEQILKNRDIPVVFLSSHTDPETVEKTEKITSYGYVVKNSSITVLDASIKMAFKLFHAKRAHDRKKAELSESENRFYELFQRAPLGYQSLDAHGNFLEVNHAWLETLGYEHHEVIGKWFGDFLAPEYVQPFRERFPLCITQGRIHSEFSMLHKDGRRKYIAFDGRVGHNEDGSFKQIHCILKDETERKKAEDALEKRLIALTLPLDSPEEIAFDELFNIADLQKLQDEFSLATNVASCITRPDGTPITKPSNSCRLCYDIIRKTNIGCANCQASDALLGQPNLNGPRVQPCLSGGLWDAGAAISVGGRHIANWLIGQVRNEAQTEENIRAYAQKIGADEDSAVAAFYEVPAMSRSQFDNIANALFILANQLSNIAYQNVQQARFIAERKQAEERLTLQSLVLDQIRDRVTVTDLNGIITYVNDAEARALGYSHEELVGASTEKFGNKSEIGATQQQILKETLEHGKWRGEVVNYTSSGEQVVQDLQTQVIVDEEGNKIAIVGFSSDITERKRIEEALAAKVHLLERIFQNSTDIISLANLEGNFTMVSTAAAKSILFDDPEELIGKHALHFVHPEDLPNISSAFADFLKTPDQNSPKVVYRQRRTDGEYLWLETVGTVLKDTHGNLEQILFNTRDITDRKKAEQEIQRQLTEKEILLKEVHHRIKNNMAQVESLLLFQADSSASVEVTFALNEAMSRIRSIRELYEKLLIGEGYKEVSMKDYLESLTDSVAQVFNDRPGVTLEKSIVDFALSPKKAVPVGIIINELLTNVFKYAFTGRDSGHISVELAKTGTLVTLTITDNGIGIDERISANKTPGFGLAIVKMLAEQLGGTFTMKNDNGTRSVAKFEI